MTQKQIYDYSKEKHPHAIAMMRVGDFYEVICDDAITCADILGITLTRRKEKDGTTTELAGFLHRALDTFLPKLVRAGKRVAVYENIDDLEKKLLVGEDYDKAKQLIRDSFAERSDEMQPVAVEEISFAKDKCFVKNLVVAKKTANGSATTSIFKNGSFGISASGHPFAAFGESQDGQSAYGEWGDCVESLRCYYNGYGYQKI